MMSLRVYQRLRTDALWEATAWWTFGIASHNVVLVRQALHLTSPQKSEERHSFGRRYTRERGASFNSFN